MLNGLDLFSGIGGIAEALSPWVRTAAYCENDKYATAVLLSRMSRGEIHTAPIWDDVTTLKGKDLPAIDIISGGFPCQDISIAGRGEGLGGKRSGLFGEIIRLVGEIRPSFIFLENVPAITFRGLDTVTATLAGIRYDCRWGLFSAYDVGAPHKRERWWLLAYANAHGGQRNGQEEELRSGRNAPNGSGENVANTGSGRQQGQRQPLDPRYTTQDKEGQANQPIYAGVRYERTTQPDICRVVNGLPFRSNRLMCLGNSVVPQCAGEAFERLAGLQQLKEGER